MSSGNRLWQKATRLVGALCPSEVCLDSLLREGVPGGFLEIGSLGLPCLEELRGRLCRLKGGGEGRVIVIASAPEGLRRLAGDATVFPIALACSATSEPRRSWEIASAMAHESASEGIDLLLAPLPGFGRELNSFGEGAQAPAHYAEFLTALHEKGVGSIALCSTTTEFEGENLDFWQEIVKAGLSVIALSEEVTRSSSVENFISVVLRSRLGFLGPLASLSPEQPVRQLESGVDILLRVEDLDKTSKLVSDAIEKGEMNERRLDIALLHLLEMRSELEARAKQRSAEAPVGSSAHRVLAERVARDSLCLFKCEGTYVPLMRFEKPIEVFDLVYEPEVSLGELLLDALGSPCLRNIRPTSASTVIIVIDHEADEVYNFIRKLTAEGRWTVLVSLGLTTWEGAHLLVVSFGSAPLYVWATLEVLLGEEEPRGKFPIRTAAKR